MMEVYILDDNFFETDPVIDTYESLVWTERFDAPGDFELVMPPDETIRARLTLGRLLSIKESNRIMVVEKIHEKPALGGGVVMTYSGSSLEGILNSRVSRAPKGGSTKVWLNHGTSRSLIDGLYHADDVIPELKMGTNKLYPASTMPPSILPAPYENQGWMELGAAHDKAADLSPLGFRIVRKPGTRDVYYDNYTGNDRSYPDKFNVADLSLTWPNPHMFETDRTVPVWTNLAKNPGLTNGLAPLAIDNAEFRMDVESTYSNVDVAYSKSGKGLEITPASSGDKPASGAFLIPAEIPLTATFHGLPCWGRTFTISATIELKTIQTGTIYEYARSIVVSGVNAGGGGSPIATAQAPNTVGVHPLTLTVTLPLMGNPSNWVAWEARLTNGSANPDQTVIWTDLCVVELPSNPVGYFDGAYSPDEDLHPVWTGEKEKSTSQLVGNAIQGAEDGNLFGCALVQSKKWGLGGVSARMIKNQPSAIHNASLVLTSGTAKKAIITQYQEEVLSGALTDFGRLELFTNTSPKAVSTAKPNTIGERTVTVLEPTGFDKVVLRGNYSTLGGSLWWSGLITTPDTSWTPTPNEQVIFSEDLDTFIVSESYTSIAGYRNVVYVCRGDYMIEVSDGYSSSGTLRRVAFADASGLDDTPTLIEDMEALGRLVLGENRRKALIDGSVPAYSRYAYDVDYFLGDLVMVRARSGARMISRVSEQIFVNDAEGFRTYPTLREEPSATTGTWYSPEYNIIWNAATGEWADQP